ncbi:ribosomal protein L13 [Anncaliia algerae PRA109]|uniref:60S RIBOSOMAL PROTEIN L13A (L16) n=1 Tax=Anncaliia algerae TaxID=723287 RepID=E3PYD2_9MICR|nr:ribosomal protein L13 [Anncaliia algerae PRA109]CBH28897.1 60S RIBOSOMAL PROTEIN L13A (L16) [Anncaliia algerae]
MCQEEIIIDGTDHIAGRLGSYIAKSLLEGKKVTVICAESIKLTGPIHRRKLSYKDFLNKRCLVNPRRGPYHWKQPSKYFMRVVKRMLPYKIKRGATALSNLTVYDGFPEEFINEKIMVYPSALLEYKADPVRKSSTLGELLSCFGWKHAEITDKLKSKVLSKLDERNAKIEQRNNKIEEFVNSNEFKKLFTKELENYE